jgi:hypothetical protein
VKNSDATVSYNAARTKSNARLNGSVARMVTNDARANCSVVKLKSNGARWSNNDSWKDSEGRTKSSADLTIGRTAVNSAVGKIKDDRMKSSAA